MPVPEQSSANAAQIDSWNATAGQTWTLFQEQLDRQITPLGQAALQALGPRKGEAVIDIGCGCGQTSLELTVAVGRTGRVLGVDVSRPMLAVARERPLPDAAARPSFLEIDAQTGDLGSAAFDAAFSRFGVMFFSDPVAAFSNIRRALKSSGRLSFVCWRSLQENPWMLAPLDAARPFLPPAVPPDPTAPGPFAFADPNRVQSILGAAGFESVRLEAFDRLIGSGDVDATLALTLKVGPLGSLLREHPEYRDAVTAVVRQALVSYATPDGVLMPAAAWIVTARCDPAGSSAGH
jgi:SAM-dependent methyltransferase